MDFIKQHKAFYSQLEYNPVSANAIALWNAFLHIANKTGWLEYFTVANKVLEAKSSLETSSLQRARNELVQKGFLVYKKGKNQSDAASYKLPVLYGQAGEQAEVPPVQYEQASEQASAQASEQASAQASAHINKPKDLKLKNLKTKDIYKPLSPAAEIIAHLNTKAGTGYKPDSKSTLRHINARLNEGYSLDDFIAVIDKKCTAWLADPKMAGYLRPETLFGTKFEGYLNEPRPKPQTRAEEMAERISGFDLGRYFDD